MKPRLRWADHFAPAIRTASGRSFTSDDLAVVRIEAYQAGLAQGELRGRLELANEIAGMFPEHGPGMSAEDAKRLRMRQVH